MGGRLARMHGRPEPPADAPARPSGPREVVQRWRLVVARAALEPDRQRTQVAGWEAALTAAGLPVAGLELDPPRPRFAFAAPLAAGVSGEAELVDAWLTERLPCWRVREALEGRLPAGNGLVDLYDVWMGEPPLPGQVVASVYRAAVLPEVDADALRSATASMLDAASLPRVRSRADRTVEYDLRPFLDSLDVMPGQTGAAFVTRMTLRHDPVKGIGRPDEVLAELGDRLGVHLETVSLVREKLVLAPERATPAAAGGMPVARPTARPGGRDRGPHRKPDGTASNDDAAHR